MVSKLNIAKATQCPLSRISVSKEKISPYYIGARSEGKSYKNYDMSGTMNIWGIHTNGDIKPIVGCIEVTRYWNGNHDQETFGADRLIDLMGADLLEITHVIIEEGDDSNLPYSITVTVHPLDAGEVKSAYEALRIDAESEII